MLLHILIALASIGYTTYLIFFPSKRQLYVSYSLIGLTVASGTYLAISLHTNILQTCETGLAYLAIVLTALVLARRAAIHVAD